MVLEDLAGEQGNPFEGTSYADIDHPMITANNTKISLVTLGGEQRSPRSSMQGPRASIQGLETDRLNQMEATGGNNSNFWSDKKPLQLSQEPNTFSKKLNASKRRRIKMNGGR